MSSTETKPGDVDADGAATAELQDVNLRENDQDHLTNTTEPPALHTPHKRRITLMTIGLLIATLDLSFLPITYFYALHFGTDLNLQLSMLSRLDGGKQCMEADSCS